MSTTFVTPSKVARTARSVLGGNGITLEHPVFRHMASFETIYTSDGTHEIHSVILGKAITDHQALS